MWLPQLACVSLGVLFSWAQVVPSPSKVQCIGSTCLALYWASRNFYEASDVCESKGGRLPTLDWKSSATVIKRLMGERPRSLWLGLATSVKSNLSHLEAAGPFCLLVNRQLKRQKRPCQTPADGFFCEYVYPNQTCARLSLPPPATATYLTPFGAWRKGLLSLPEGTRAELPPGMGGPLTCSPGGTWGRDLPGAWDCRLVNGGCKGQCRRDDEGRPSCTCPGGSFLREEDGRSCRSPCAALDCQHFCVPQGEAAVCLCSEGYALEADGRSCVDVDDCQAVPGPCEQECVNTPGAFECRCFPGHEEVEGKCLEDAQDCFDLDCQHDCARVGAQFACICFEGFVPHPEKPNECVRFCNQTECPPQCDPHTGESCECPEGYILDVKTDGSHVCTDIDECDSGYCGHLKCVNTPGSYSCKCPNGRFVQDGKFCQ